MRIKQYLTHNKTALGVYKTYRKLYLQKQSKNIYIQPALDTKSNCYVKGSFYIFSREKVKNVTVKFNDELIEIQYYPDDKFSHKFPGFFEYEVQLPVIGFPDFKENNNLSVNVDAFILSEKKHFTLDLPFETATELVKVKLEKLERIKELLICPLTKEDLIESTSHFESTGLGQLYKKNIFSYNFLPPELAATFNIIPTFNISAHDNSYYEEQIIAELRQKGIDQPLILDCGAGLKPVYRKEVVNFEIVNYPTTDIIGVNEKLPFKDNSFDAVFSAAVLEHVKDPFASAKEISRVLKPGGILMAFVPFLQPYHGYPHHYYNMTVSGIRNLFEGDIDIKEIGTNLHPLDLMPWYINRYTNSLNKKDEKTFLNLKLKDFRNLNKLSSQGFYKNISQQTHEELAFVVKAIGYKKL
jgi:ubiquinone/menaquinone biosynthesis C-methylase UbiE